MEKDVEGLSCQKLVPATLREVVVHESQQLQLQRTDYINFIIHFVVFVGDCLRTLVPVPPTQPINYQE